MRDGVIVFVHWCAYNYVCLCVCAREREGVGERERERERGRQAGRHAGVSNQCVI